MTQVKAQMAGTVFEVSVKEGDSVKKQMAQWQKWLLLKAILWKKMMC